MARNIIKSFNAIVAAQDATVAFSTANQGLKLHKITQGLNYSIDYPYYNKYRFNWCTIHS